MLVVFYVAAVIAVISTVLMLLSFEAVRALLYLIVSLLAVSVVFYTLGAPFVAALEVIIYAGAIMVLFVFVVMLLNLGPRGIALERGWLRPTTWAGPAILAACLIAELVYLARFISAGAAGIVVEPKQVGLALYGPYLIGVELASLLLLSAVVGAYHLGFRHKQDRNVKRRDLESQNVSHTYSPRIDSGGDFVRAGTDRTSGAP